MKKAFAAAALAGTLAALPAHAETTKIKCVLDTYEQGVTGIPQVFTLAYDSDTRAATVEGSLDTAGDGYSFELRPSAKHADDKWFQHMDLILRPSAAASQAFGTLAIKETFTLTKKDGVVFELDKPFTWGAGIVFCNLHHPKQVLSPN
jgi:hypothetical protein